VRRTEVQSIPIFVRRATNAGLVAAIIATLGVSFAYAQNASPPPAVDTLQVRIDSLLDLDAVVARSLRASPQVTQGEEQIRAARSEQRVSVGAYMPTLSANSSLLRSNVLGGTSLPGLDVPDSRSAGLAASLDVFTGGRRGADRDRARADVAAAVASDVTGRFAATLTAQRAFYDELRASDLVDVAKARVSQADRGYRYAQDRVRAGTTTRSDELRARLEMTTARQQLVASLDTLQTAAYALGRLVGANGPIGARPPSSLEPRTLTMSDTQIVQLAVDYSPGVQSARAAERANVAATKSARTLFVPDLRVTGGYNWANQTPIVSAVRPGWALAVGTTFPLFNGFQREDAVTRAEAAAEVSRVTSLDVTRQTRAEAARLLSGLRFAEQNISLANDAVSSAVEDLRVQTERYRAGISTELDQLSSELAVTQARLALVAARFTYQVTRAQLEALVGRPL
jgi:outer membrane protein